jgi:hypothetical protein
MTMLGHQTNTDTIVILAWADDIDDYVIRKLLNDGRALNTQREAVVVTQVPFSSCIHARSTLLTCHLEWV